jgi:hypothetical protein
MSDLIPNPVALNTGLDLSTAKLLAEPGSMIDCLNYEVVDELGYRRIDGYAAYDGHPILTDFPSIQTYTAVIINTGVPVDAIFTYAPFEDFNGNEVGLIIEAEYNVATDDLTVLYVSYEGYAYPAGTIPSQGISWGSTDVSDVEVAALTQAQFQGVQDYLLGEVNTALPGEAVGLHWHRDALYAVAPYTLLHYEASIPNVEVEYVIGDGLFTDAGLGNAVLLDKIVTIPADTLVAEEGYFIINSTDAQWLQSSAELSGAVTVAGGVINQTGYTVGSDSDYCGIWKAQRPATYGFTKAYVEPGWTAMLPSYSVQVTLSGVTDELNATNRGATEAESTYYFDDGAGTVEVVLIDYFVLDGAFDTGDAVIVMQFGRPLYDSGTHDNDVTTADDLYTDAAATIKIADVTARMTLTALPGLPSLKENASRYEFISANFYASEGLDAIYGVNGAGRAFKYRNGILTFIYTQADADLDKPRHVENHALHLALGFAEGSVQLSVVGDPTNFDGFLGASEIGVGDRVTGLMALPGSTLGIFCEQSIWSLVGSTIDAFDKQVISPKTGCIEYTLVNCGQPLFCNNTGISTLDTSANYGDFLGTKLSKRISSWLIPRLRRGNTITINRAGIACAIPIRTKNQYRLFFNDGSILTLTLREEGGPAFTFQRYFYGGSSDDTYSLVPLASTSQVDLEGKERIFISHYNEDSPVETPVVFALESGDSFNGYYIAHYFDINWYFGQAPSTYMTLQGVRAFGLSKGLASLNIYATGPQTDFYFSGNVFSTTTTPLNFPRNNPIGIVPDLRPVTNRCDISARGLALQVRIAGSNTNVNLIEPTHVVQVLTLYTTPAGAFDL